MNNLISQYSRSSIFLRLSGFFIYIIMFVVLYSKEQKYFHIETFREYENKPQNGYYIEAIFDTYQECSDFIKQNRNNKIYL